MLLAAGASSRFGRTKQVAKIGGRTLLERALDGIPDSMVRETIVVLGHDAEAVAGALKEREGTATVFNPDYMEGMSSSIRAGVRAVSSKSGGVLLLLADQPFVSRSLLVRMLKKFDAGGSRAIVAAEHDGLVTPPVIFSRRYFAELEAIGGDRGAKSVIERHADALTLLKVRSNAVLFDVDTPEDIRMARRLAEA